MLQLAAELLVLFGLIGRVVHLLADINHLLEVVHDLVEVVEAELRVADVDDHVEDVLLAFHGRHGIHLIEGVLLEDDEVYQLGFPEDDMVVYGHTVIAQNVNLLGNLLASLQAGLYLVHLAQPFAVDALGDVVLKLWIFDVLRIGINGIDGRITFLVRTVLLQRVKATGHFLGVLGHGLLEVTTGGRHGTDKGNGTRLSVVQHHVSGTSVEVGDNGRQVHGEGIGTGKFLHTVGHLTQGLCPTGSRVGHQQHLQAHAAVIFGNGHGGVDGSLTGSYRHVGCVGDDDGTLHQLAACVRVDQFGELCEDFHYLVGTLTAGGYNHDVRLSLLGNSVLKHRLTRTEGAGNKARSAFYDGVHRIYDAHTRLQQLEGTRFLFIVGHGALHGPLLYHVDGHFRTILGNEHSHGVLDGVIAFGHNGFHGADTFLRERHHNL